MRSGARGSNLPTIPRSTAPVEVEPEESTAGHLAYMPVERP
ncbi:hypothetical protein [Streptomyces sp. NBC_01314]|nr:hypothetical protein OG622_45290 [Streptomyces sp. NBC_01314]